jgi:hypothetical protein
LTHDVHRAGVAAARLFDVEFFFARYYQGGVYVPYQVSNGAECE